MLPQRIVGLALRIRIQYRLYTDRIRSELQVKLTRIFATVSLDTMGNKVDKQKVWEQPEENAVVTVENKVEEDAQNPKAVDVCTAESKIRLDLLEQCSKQKEIKAIRSQVVQRVVPSMNELEIQTKMMESIVNRVTHDQNNENANLMSLIVMNMKVRMFTNTISIFAVRIHVCIVKCLKQYI